MWLVILGLAVAGIGVLLAKGIIGETLMILGILIAEIGVLFPGLAKRERANESDLLPINLNEETDLDLDVFNQLRFIKEIEENEADFGAFMKRFQILPPLFPSLDKYKLLLRHSFAVCDSFDIQGHVTGFGNPDWERTHEPATQTNAFVAELIEVGATLIGKTVVSDMALSITGENCHYGTPTNPFAPELIPGGVSSGAAIATAAKLANFSLGIDTDGGVRVAAAYCGACGFRPSHGIISLSGVIPVSPSLDTVGWFARSVRELGKVGCIVLPTTCNFLKPSRYARTFLIADDCFSLTKFPAKHLTHLLVKSIIPGRTVRRVDLGDYLGRNVPSLNLFHLKEFGGIGLNSQITVLANVMQKLKRFEFMQNHSEWIDSVKPTLDPASSRQVSETKGLADFEVEICQSIMREMRLAICSLLKGDTILVIPTCINTPSKLGAKEILFEDYLIRTSALSSLASMSGCCEVAIPVGFYEKSPVSVSLLAEHGCDKFLLNVAEIFQYDLQKKVQEVTKCKAPISLLEELTIQSANEALTKGRNAFLEKKWQEAIAYHTTAIKLNGSNEVFYNERAAAYFEMKSYAQVESDCTKAIELDENSKRKNRHQSVTAYILRGTTRTWLNNFNGAKEDYRSALSLDPTNDRAYKALEWIDGC